MGARLVAAMLEGLAASRPAWAEVDADAAQAPAKGNHCFRGHAIDKTKKAPADRKIAARLRSKADAVARVIEHITSGPRVQLEDGSEEEHRIIDTRNPKQLDNLARWILSL